MKSEEDWFPFVIEEKQNVWTPALIVTGLLLASLFFWNKTYYFWGCIGAAAIFALYLFAGHRKIAVYPKKREIRILSCRVWGEKLEAAIPFGDVKEFTIRKSLGSGESGPDFHPYLLTRSGHCYELMTGMELGSDDAERTISSLKTAMGWPTA